MDRSRVISSVFYGIPAELIADWCGVSLETARRWKTGQTQPSASALKLFVLYRDRKVLNKEWDGWLINRETLVDPEGNATTQGQLRAYAHVYALCQELARGNDEAQKILELAMLKAG